MAATSLSRRVGVTFPSLRNTRTTSPLAFFSDSTADSGKFESAGNPPNQAGKHRATAATVSSGAHTLAFFTARNSPVVFGFGHSLIGGASLKPGATTARKSTATCGSAVLPILIVYVPRTNLGALTMTLGCGEE